MSIVNHNHYVTAQRGGAFMSGSSAAGGNITSQKIDTPEYSRHNLSHTIRTSAQPGELYPIDSMAVLPGDNISLDGCLTSMFMPTNKPFLDEFEQTLHTYFCPTRLLDPTWEMFFTGGKDGKYSYPRYCFDFGAMANNIANMKWFSMLSTDSSYSSDVAGYDLKKACSYGSPFDLFHLPCGTDDATTASVNSPLIEAGASWAANGKQIPTLFDKFMMMQRVYNEYYRLPEFETDLFLNVPETPDEVMRDIMQKTIAALQAKASFSSQSAYAMFVAASGQQETGQFWKDIMINAAYQYIQSNDGVFWRLHEFFAKHPEQLDFGVQGTVYYGTQSQTLYTLSDPCIHYRWSKDLSRDISKITKTSSSVYQIGADMINSIHHLYGTSQPSSTIVDGEYGGTLGNTYWIDDACVSGNSAYLLPPEWTDSLAGNISIDTVLCSVITALIISTMKPHSMCYERDKFNIALPYTQRGVAAKLAANIYTNSSTVQGFTVNTSSTPSTGTYGDAISGWYQVLNSSASNLASIFTENDLRNLAADTRFLEKAAKFGYRYDEYLRGLFGITSATTALDRAMYIGGLKSTLNSTRVTNMSGTADANGNVQIGQWSGEAGTNANGFIGKWSAAENGYIMSFYCMKPRLSYANINDVENHKVVDRTQYFTPDYAYIQEQPISAHELRSADVLEFAQFANGLSPYRDDGVYGNVPRYNEYRQIPSTTHGIIADPNNADLQCFTASRNIESLAPKSDFVTFNHVRPYDEDIARLFQVDPTVVAPIIIEFGVGVDATRLVPQFSKSL